MGLQATNLTEVHMGEDEEGPKGHVNWALLSLPDETMLVPGGDTEQASVPQGMKGIMMPSCVLQTLLPLRNQQAITH